MFTKSNLLLKCESQCSRCVSAVCKLNSFNFKLLGAAARSVCLCLLFVGTVFADHVNLDKMTRWAEHPKRTILCGGGR